MPDPLEPLPLPSGVPAAMARDERPRQGRRTIVALSLVRMVDSLGYAMVVVLLPLYVVTMPLPAVRGVRLSEPAAVGILIAAYGVALWASQAPAGRWSDRVRQRRPFIIGGLGALALSNVVYLLANSYWQVMAVRVAQGVGVAFTVPASLAIIRSRTRLAYRGEAMGIYTTFQMAGSAMGPPIGGFLHDHQGFEAPFVVAAGAAALAALLVVTIVEEPAPDGRDEDEEGRGGGGGQGGAPAGASGPQAEAKGVGSRGAPPGELRAISFALMAMATCVSMMTALENDINSRLHQTPTMFGIAFSTLIVTRVLFQYPAGRLSDRIGRRPLILIGLVFLAPATALMGWVGSSAGLIGVRALQGVATAGIAGPAMALAADKARGAAAASEIASVSGAFGLGIVLGPLVGGILASTVSFEAPFLFAGALCLAVAALVEVRTTDTVGRAVRAQPIRNDAK